MPPEFRDPPEAPPRSFLGIEGSNHHSFYHGFMLLLRLCGLDDRPGYLDVVSHL